MTCMSIRVTLIQCSERGGSSAEAQDIHLGGGHWITKWVSNITVKGADVGRCVGITFLTRHRYWRLQDGVWRGYTPGRIGSRRYWQNERKTGLTGRLLETSKGRNMCIDDAIPPLPFPPWFTLRTETLSIRHLAYANNNATGNFWPKNKKKSKDLTIYLSGSTKCIDNSTTCFDSSPNIHEKRHTWRCLRLISIIWMLSVTFLHSLTYVVKLIW